MDKINGDDSAFAFGFCTADGSNHIIEKGLNKREYFAAQAMKGLLSNYGINKDTVSDSVIIADRLIEELNKH